MSIPATGAMRAFTVGNFVFVSIRASLAQKEKTGAVSSAGFSTRSL
jgi:hypothetical protein